MTLSTHVLDTATGLPAAGVPVRAARLVGADWTPVAAARTDTDGRVRELVPAGTWGAGTWRVEFDTAACSPFYPRVSIEVQVADDRPCHVPLLLSPYGYTTYRGS